MLTNPLVQQHVTLTDPLADVDTVNRLLAAAVVSKRFCASLLGSPREAIRAGFAGEGFNLSARTLEFLASIKVGTLREFAEQVNLNLSAHLATAM
jgi:hypothetical protein